MTNKHIKPLVAIGILMKTCVIIVVSPSCERNRIMALYCSHFISTKWQTLACLLKCPGHMWSKHNLILCMSGREMLPNNLVLYSLLNNDILYGMLKTYWKPLVRCVGVTDAVSVTGLYLPIQTVHSVRRAELFGKNEYRQTSNISNINSQNLSIYRLVLQLSLPKY